MDFKSSHGHLIKLCRPIRALVEKLRNEIKEQFRRSKLPQRKKKLYSASPDPSGYGPGPKKSAGLNGPKFPISVGSGPTKLKAGQGQAGLTTGPQSKLTALVKKGKETDPQCCGICYDFKQESDMFRVSHKCKHNFCIDCVSKWVASQIEENIRQVITCPDPKCSMELKPEFFHTILPKEVIVRWESARIEYSIPLSQKTYCPFKNCSVLLVNDGRKVVKRSKCPSCHRVFCAQCKVRWHGKMKCEEFQEMLKMSTSEKEDYLDMKFLKLVKRKSWQRCPKCSVYVAKRDGCVHIKCRCGHNFCYYCGKRWKLAHICSTRRSS